MPLHKATTIRIERNPGLADRFAALEINEEINGHHTFALDLPSWPTLFPSSAIKNLDIISHV